MPDVRAAFDSAYQLECTLQQAAYAKIDVAFCAVISPSINLR